MVSVRGAPADGLRIAARRIQGRGLHESGHSTDATATHRSTGTAGDAIVIVDARDKIVCASPSAEILLSGSAQVPSPLIGRALTEVVATGSEGSQIAVEVLGTLSLPSIGGDARILRLVATEAIPAAAGRQAETVAVLAHEVKTPLTAIIGALTLIDADAVGMVSPEVKPLVDMALRNARRVHVMINDVLDAETIPAGGMTLEPTDLTQVVRRSSDDFSGIASAKGVELRLHVGDNPVLVLGNAERLERAVENLLSNAAKFSDPGGTVEVRLDCDGDRSRITVADTGPGVPLSFQPMIFQKFAKHDVEDGRNREGTGLGLSIAKAIVEAHSGRIGFASRPGGTRFWLDFPLHKGDEPDG